MTELPGRMGVQAHPDPVDRGGQRLTASVVPEQALDLGELLGFKHRLLGKHQLKNRVVWHSRPVDQVVYYVLVGAERQHLAHHADSRRAHPGRESPTGGSRRRS